MLSSGEPDRASGVLLRRGGEEPLCRVADASRQAQVQIPTLRACMRVNDIFTATYSPGADPLVPSCALSGSAHMTLGIVGATLDIGGWGWASWQKRVE